MFCQDTYWKDYTSRNAMSNAFSSPHPAYVPDAPPFLGLIVSVVREDNKYIYNAR